MTLCFHNTQLDPTFNLAAEEHLLRHIDQDVFMLWRNQPSIIIGRNQNAHAEINLDFVKENDVKVVRRLSGGGAVFHDLGNVNFTFIVSKPNGPKLDFKRFTQPIIAALAELGVEAKFEGRNDLTVNGLKISGNAQHIHKDRILHHGTLLYQARLNHLTRALKANPAKFEDKAVKSIRSRVTNITDHMTDPPEVEVFINRIMHFVMETLPTAEVYQWSREDLRAIEKLRREKYSRWSWNFGRSPDYNFVNSLRSQAGTVEVHLQIEAGSIKGARIFGDFFGVRSVNELEDALVGSRHQLEALEARLQDTDINEYIQGLSKDQFIKSLF